MRGVVSTRRMKGRGSRFDLRFPPVSSTGLLLYIPLFLARVFLALLFLAPLFLTPANAMGDDDAPSIGAQLDRTHVQMGDVVTLTVTVEGRGSDGHPSVMSGDGYHATFQGTSQNFSFVNGRTSSTTSYTFRVIPRRQGLIHIGPVHVTVDGDRYEINPLELRVDAAAQTPNQQRSRPRTQTPNQRDSGRDSGRGGGRDPAGDDFFVTTQVDRDTVYIHQQVVLIFRFYTGPDVSFTTRPNYSPPSTVGFLEESMGEQKRFTVRRDGKVYSVTEIKTALYPTRAGTLTIGPAEVDCAVEDRSRPSRSPFPFFGRRYAEKKKRLRSEPIRLVVRSLPRAGRPADFDGAVGQFSIDLRTDAATVKANDAVTLKAVISGTGSVNTLGNLELQAPASIRIFDSGVEAQSIPTGAAVKAEKVFTWILIPTEAEDVTIPPLTLSYFDPMQERFTRASSRPVKLHVLPGETEELVTLGGRGLPIVDEDIRYLKTNLESLRYGSGSIFARLLPWVNLLPILGLIFAVLFNQRRRRLEADIQGYRRHGALKSAKNRIRQLKSEECNSWQRCGAIIEDYLADRLNHERHGVQRSLLLEEMRSAGLRDPLMKDLAEFWEICDLSAYAPQASAPILPGIDKEAPMEQPEQGPEGKAEQLLELLESAFRETQG